MARNRAQGIIMYGDGSWIVNNSRSNSYQSSFTSPLASNWDTNAPIYVITPALGSLLQERLQSIKNNKENNRYFVTLAVGDNTNLNSVWRYSMVILSVRNQF